jgi:DNA-binding NarL/FixJ family response regulator
MAITDRISSIASGSGLTSREQEVLAQLILAKTNRQIAEALVIRETTVENHLHHIYRKLGVASRSAAIALVLTGGLDASMR